MTDVVISLPSELTIVQIDEYYRSIVPILENNDSFILEDKNIARIDTIGVQFIVALVNYIESHHKKLQWTSMKSSVKKAIQHLGINDSLLLNFIQHSEQQ